MERVTVRVPVRLLARVDRAVSEGEWANRSEAVRAGLRTVIGESGVRAVADGCGGSDDPNGEGEDSATIGDRFQYAPVVCSSCEQRVSLTVKRDDAQPIRYECGCASGSPTTGFPSEWDVPDTEVV